MNYWQMIKQGHLPFLCTALRHSMQYPVPKPFEISYPISISLNNFNLVIDSFGIAIGIWNIK